MNRSHRLRGRVAVVTGGEEQAAMAAFLASDDAAHIVAQSYNVGGGSVAS